MNLKLRKEQKTNLLGWVFFFFSQLVKSSLAASGSPPPHHAPQPPGRGLCYKVIKWRKNLSPSGWDGGIKHKVIFSVITWEGRWWLKWQGGYLGERLKSTKESLACTCWWRMCTLVSRLDGLQLGVELKQEDFRILATHLQEKCWGLGSGFWSETCWCFKEKYFHHPLFPHRKKTVLSPRNL